MLNENSNTDADSPGCEDFAKMFKNLGTVNSDESVPDSTHNSEPHPYLDADITEEEVLEAARKLKNNKSHGLDMVLNEFAKPFTGVRAFYRSLEYILRKIMD